MVLSMDRWINKVAIVTGANSGIGAAIAKKLVREGLTVVGVDLCADHLDYLKGKLKNEKGALHSVIANVKEEESILAAFEWVKKNAGPIHILVNCAGISRITDLLDGDTKMWKDTFDVNVIGLCIATREAVKDMRKNDVAGQIIHLNSVFGHEGSSKPHVNVYSASKYAVTCLTETLRQELNEAKTKIKVSSISPGVVDTNIINASVSGSGLKEIPEKLKLFKSTAPSLKADDIANAVIYILSTPPHVQVHELTIKPIGESF